ncbi:MAG: PQQ-binding-like beta-propeller repeat protein [Pirellulaceae bacterium]|nr:PQQ-binding-like beta-propeller repeat protein [Pirellulaceae bacterium]
MLRTIQCVVCFVLSSSLLTATLRGENWARFRGPDGAGVSSQKGLPVAWTEKDYAWKVKLPGLGHSSPSVWNDRIFVTSSPDDGRRRIVFCVDAQSGETLWSRTVKSKTHAKHAHNSFASATPATDGTGVYVLFASDKQLQIVAYDFEGETLWTKNLGAFLQRDGQVHGCGTSAIVFEDQVIVANQQDGDSAIISLDSKSGNVRWQRDRELRLTAHSTPVIWRGDNGPQLVISNTGDGIASLDPRTGKMLFRADVLTARCVSSPVVAGNLALATCGGGGRGRFVAAFPLTSRGDLEAADAVWIREKNLPYVPTPLAFGSHVYLWGDNGVVACIEAATGKELWIERVGGNYYTSPIAVDGKIYCISQAGVVNVIASGPQFKLLGKTELGEGCHTTPAVAAGRMILRGFEHLYCLNADAAAN